ncbi:hypothetical protein D3C73_934420 [compost metagenome]
MSQAGQLEIDLAGQLLVQATLAGDAVVAEADLQCAEVPLLAAAIGLGLDDRRLAAQFSLEVEIGVEAELVVLQFTFAAQGSGQDAWQLGNPVRRVDGRQVERGVPGDAIGKLQVQVAVGLALPRLELDLLQMDFGQVAGEWAAHVERPGRAIQRRLEVAQVLAVGVGDFAVETPQRHLRFVDERIEAVPGKILPVDVRRGVEAFAPVDDARELEALLVVGRQVQPGDLRTVGVYLALQR